MYLFTFPLPPSLNALYGGGSRQRRFKTAKYKSWELIAPVTPALNLDSFHITYNLFFPDFIVRDSKNFLKAIDDWLAKCGTIQDDNWKIMKHETIIPHLDRGNPRIEVTLTPV